MWQIYREYNINQGYEIHYWVIEYGDMWSEFEMRNSLYKVQRVPHTYIFAISSMIKLLQTKSETIIWEDNLR